MAQKQKKKKNQVKPIPFPKSIDDFKSVTQNKKDQLKLPACITDLPFEDPKTSDYVSCETSLNFKYYNSKSCELHMMEINETKKLINVLKKINSVTVKQFFHECIKKPPIIDREKSCYKDICEELPKDFDLFEIELLGTNRLFFTVLRDKILIFAITKRHRDKNKA